MEHKPLLPDVRALPLAIYSITFRGLTLCVPVPGRYDLVLLLNGEEAARRAVWMLPAGQQG